MVSEWSSEDVVKFLDVYGESEGLWNIRYSGYNNKIKRDSATTTTAIIIIITIRRRRRRRTAKTRPENKETTNDSWTASSKSGCKSLVCPQQTGRKGLDAVRSSPCSRNYKIREICRKMKEDPLIQVVRTHQHNTD